MELQSSSTAECARLPHAVPREWHPRREREQKVASSIYDAQSGGSLLSQSGLWLEWLGHSAISPRTSGISFSG